eukprot:1013929-Pyramimonas_sp.AAC.1
MRYVRDCASLLSRSTLLGSPPDSYIGSSVPSSSTRSIAPSASARCSAAPSAGAGAACLPHPTAWPKYVGAGGIPLAIP